jgi:hypothetical protein
MRKVLLSFLPLAVWLGGAAAVRGQDEAHALVAQAVAAQGGEDRLGGGAVRVLKFKGTLFYPADGPTFTGDLCSGPRGRFKSALHLEVGTARISVAQALDGKAGWRCLDGRTEDLKGAQLVALQRSGYVERVLTLVPLLREPGYTLTPLGESAVDGRPVLGVKVSAADRPDVSLYFERASHLLVKYAFRDQDPASKSEVLHETVLSDYREPDLGAADERTLRSAGRPVAGPGLLKFLRQRTPPAADAAGVRRLVRQLGDDSFDARQKASTELIALGPAATPFLREAAANGDAEVARRARECLERIREPADAAQVSAAVRLAGLRAPDGAAEALLTLLVRTRDEALAREVRAALAAVGARAAKPDPALLRALQDRDPQRQAAAAAALGRDGGAYARLPGRRLYLTGLKLPMKAVSYTDGKKVAERTVVAVEFFNEFDDSVFARPAEPGPQAAGH